MAEATLFSQAHESAPYTHFRSSCVYITITGKKQAPLGGPPRADGVTCEIVQTAQPLGQKIIFWSAERQGDMPAIPDPNSKDDNEVLGRTEFQPLSVELLGDGKTHVYRISGRYDYMLRKPVKLEDGKMTFGASPYDKTPKESYVISPGAVSGDLV